MTTVLKRAQDPRSTSRIDCFALLPARIAELAQLPIADMCDELLRFAPHDDDIALAALRTQPLTSTSPESILSARSPTLLWSVADQRRTHHGTQTGAGSARARKS